MEEGTERGKALLGLDVCHLAVTKSGLGEAASRERRQAGSNSRCLVPGRRFEERGLLSGLLISPALSLKKSGEGQDRVTLVARPPSQDKSLRKRVGPAPQWLQEMARL